MALVQSNGFAHVRLTVTDIKRSKAFYDQVFGWPVAIDKSDEADDAEKRNDPEEFYAGVVYETPQGVLLGLRPVGSASFDPDATGLDHVSFAVGSVEELEEIAGKLDEAGISHGDVTDIGMMTILSIQDPDDINLELAVPKD